MVIVSTMPLFGEMQNLGLWFRKAAECFKWGLMAQTSKSLEDCDTESDLKYEGLAQSLKKEYQYVAYGLFL